MVCNALMAATSMTSALHTKFFFFYGPFKNNKNNKKTWHSTWHIASIFIFNYLKNIIFLANCIPSRRLVCRIYEGNIYCLCILCMFIFSTSLYNNNMYTEQ